MTVSTNRCCQQHEMSVRTLAVVFVGMAVVGVVRSSRLPLVVFQQHHNHHHHLYDEQDIQQLEETTAPAGDYHHHLPHFHHFNDGRGIRVLYQVGVSKIFELLRLHSSGYSIICDLFAKSQKRVIIISVRACDNSNKTINRFPRNFIIWELY